MRPPNHPPFVQLPAPRVRSGSMLGVSKMSLKNTSAAAPGEANVVDYLEAMLREGKVPRLDELLKLAPDEPFMSAKLLRLGEAGPESARVIGMDRTTRKQRSPSGAPLLHDASLILRLAMYWQ